MTIEQLEQYRGICSNIAAIKEELNNAYYPIASPSGKTDGGHGSTPGAPTERAAFKAMDLEERLTQRMAEQAKAAAEIESWLLTVADAEIESVIRWLYVLGLNWRQTTLKVYGYGDPYRTRKKIFRYFGKEK